ncbi:cobalt-precorrin-6A reductase [Pseudohoeflea coraliihabitans]|uniref:cobalt-precorrin-6A reductase n=1 Tax=Pseudohoeflea coraliihabitans TaxID=2860393 RepID=UPI003204E8F9
MLILGGTQEAADLAARLVEDAPQWRIVTSLAGRTQAPRPLPGQVRSGGFGGAEGLARYLADNAISALVDATHPFATQMSANAAAAAAETATPLYRLCRPPWQPRSEDKWQIVDSLQAAAARLPEASTAFLALGHQHIGAFARRRDCRFVLRMIDPPAAPLPFDATLVLGRPGLSPDAEADTLAAHGVTHLVCRNSGGRIGWSKLEAARRLGLAVIMLARPPEPAAAHFDDVETVVAALIAADC